MRSIDIHAHLTPQCFIRAMQAGREWHGIKPGSVRIAPRAVWTPEQRLADRLEPTVYRLRKYQVLTRYQ